MKKVIFMLLGLVLIGAGLASCGGGASTKVRVATDATWPPFESVNDQTKQIEGFDIDFMNAVAAKENLNIEYINVAFDPLLAGMAQGTYDAAISSITITEDRKKDMLFSDPYYAAGQIVVVLKSNTTVNSKNDLTGSVGAQLGTTGAMEVQKITTATLKTYDDIGLAFQDLMNGQITAVVCDNPVAVQYVNQNPDKLKLAGTVFTNEYYGIVFRKGDVSVKKVNEILSSLRIKGILTDLKQKWLD